MVGVMTGGGRMARKYYKGYKVSSLSGTVASLLGLKKSSHSSKASSRGRSSAGGSRRARRR